jgi:hypothetical protein
VALVCDDEAFPKAMLAPDGGADDQLVKLAGTKPWEEETRSVEMPTAVPTAYVPAPLALGPYPETTARLNVGEVPADRAAPGLVTLPNALVNVTL